MTKDEWEHAATSCDSSRYSGILVILEIFFKLSRRFASSWQTRCRSGMARQNLP